MLAIDYSCALISELQQDGDSLLPVLRFCDLMGKKIRLHRLSDARKVSSSDSIYKRPLLHISVATASMSSVLG